MFYHLIHSRQEISKWKKNSFKSPPKGFFKDKIFWGSLRRNEVVHTQKNVRWFLNSHRTNLIRVLDYFWSFLVKVVSEIIFTRSYILEWKSVDNNENQWTTDINLCADLNQEETGITLSTQRVLQNPLCDWQCFLALAPTWCLHVVIFWLPWDVYTLHFKLISC